MEVTSNVSSTKEEFEMNSSFSDEQQQIVEDDALEEETQAEISQHSQMVVQPITYNKMFQQENGSTGGTSALGSTSHSKKLKRHVPMYFI